ncbi:MAG: SUMF1/EgtB/PvdO family nonheme iron enzyme [Nitrospinae bacterium]|nr:SUMF1/EgtB/PvdO family nonheme iron enzyme [Nitrospinota bacterium]
MRLQGLGIASRLQCGARRDPGQHRGAARLKKTPGNKKTGVLSAAIFILSTLASPLAFAQEAPNQVVIEAGEFVMGDTYCQDRQKNSDWCSDEVSHSARLGRFAIDKREVTNAQYNECVAASVCNPNAIHEFRPTDFNRPQQPVAFVTWEDAKTYCQWRKARLPTEAEWERAAQGKNPGGAYFGRPYDKGAPQDVGLLVPNANGLFDMMGNVYEWTQDWYGPYQTAEVQADPQGPSQGKEKVVRGGSWNSPSHYLRAADRVARSPELQFSDVGFRCAASLP